MSDPVKNAEVEDVLSSIRRLVSEEKRPLQAAPPEVVEEPQVEEKAAAPSIDRLVLTPALRVEEVADKPASSVQPLVLTPDLQEASEVEPQEEAYSNSDAADPSEDEAQASVVDDSTDTEVDGATDVEEISEDYQDDPYNFEDADDVDGEGAFQPDTPTSSDAPSAADATSALSAKIAALETAIGDISDEWEPDGKSADAYAGKETAAMVWEDDEDADQAPETQEETPVSERTEAIRDAIADGASKAVLEDVEKAIQDVAFEEIAPEASQEDAIADDAPSTDTDDHVDLAAEEQMLDEDALRELISEIVHSELQGALGERITRNVRRLVRREIHRALTARDLD